MKQLLHVAMILTAVICLAGCFDYAERIELNADGSGTLLQHMVLSKEGFKGMLQMMQSFAPDSSAESNADSNMFSFVKRADIEKKLADNKGGVKLLDFKETQTDSAAIYDIKYSFTKLDEMMKISNNMNMGESDMMGDMMPKKSIFWSKDDKGNWNFSREFGDSSMSKVMHPGPDPTAEEVPPSDEADSVQAEDPFGGMGKMMEMMFKQAFAGHTVKLSVKFPGSIVESNATRINGSEATWEYKLSDLTTAPSKIQAVIKP